MKHTWPIIWLDEVDSTNNYANSLMVENKIYNETVISAYSQMSGRGQQGNFWESETKMNLTFTVLLYTKYLSVEMQFALSQATALSLRDMLQQYNIQAKVKWPNDIFVNDKKVAGILIENSIMGSTFSYSCIGVGLNVNQTFFGDYLPKATSMKLINGKENNIHEVLDNFLDNFHDRIEQVRNKAFDKLKSDYVLNLYQFGQWCNYKTGQTIFKGKIIDVNTNGELVILSDEGKQRLFMFKEIIFL